MRLLRDVPQGCICTLHGVELVKLDDVGGAALVLTKGVAVAHEPFDAEAKRKRHNDYIGSNLESVTWAWAVQIFEGDDAALPLDLTTMDGMTDYGALERWARALTIDEYCAYRHLIPKVGAPYWLATGVSASPRSDGWGVYVVCTPGHVVIRNATATGMSVRPALTLRGDVEVAADVH